MLKRNRAEAGAGAGLGAVEGVGPEGETGAADMVGVLLAKDQAEEGMGKPR